MIIISPGAHWISLFAIRLSLVCKEALRLGAEKLYISSHSSKESQAAYRALGCTPAEEINVSRVAEEPFDVQLEYRLCITE